MSQQRIKFVAEGAAVRECTQTPSFGDEAIAVVDFYRNLVLPTDKKEQNKQVTPSVAASTLTIADAEPVLSVTVDSSIIATTQPVDLPDSLLWCKVCNIALSTASMEQHQHSIAHLASRSDYPDLPDPITLNETNLGYRMLRQAGWEDEQGLGVGSQGRRHPVSARMRPKQLGLGAKRRRSPSPISLPDNSLMQRDVARQTDADRLERLELLAYLKR
ncbi:hypothetical protein BDF19DRAFT_440172 [Syncephalis fuscata]|nr:hypothetical protein BDF19DRAFT_440172 [Syncephalis fuscata]